MSDEQMASRARIYTIGHSNLELDRFIATLSDVGISTLVDVRSVPYSRFTPWFNRESLDQSLAKAGVTYRYGGEYLGGRPNDPTCYFSGELPDEHANYLEEVDYDEVAKRPWFQRGLQRVIALAQSESVAVMCSEEDPAQCHRYHLITQALLPMVDVLDVRTSGAPTWRVAVAVPKPKQSALF